MYLIFNPVHFFVDDSIFNSGEMLALGNVQICSCFVNCGEKPPSILLPLDTIKKREIKLIKNSTIFTIQAHRRTISALSLYI